MVSVMCDVFECSSLNRQSALNLIHPKKGNVSREDLALKFVLFEVKSIIKAKFLFEVRSLYGAIVLFETSTPLLARYLSEQ